MATRNVKDNSYKLVFNEPELFVEFLRDFVRLDVLNDVTPADIVDVSERYIPLFVDAKDSDTVKRINLKGSPPLFVIAILEHESQVNYRASFKMLQYTALVYNEYEKDVNKQTPNASTAKDFKYPPVLPIIFYDGIDEWTSELNFYNRVALNDVFRKYIPKFEYELVDLSDYSVDDIVTFGDTLSLIMLIDKLDFRDSDSILSKLPMEYFNELALNIPPHLNKLLSDVLTLMLKRINASEPDINEIMQYIDKRRYQTMFSRFENSVLAAREEGVQKGFQDGERLKEQQMNRNIVLNMRSEGYSDELISKLTLIPIEKVREITETN